MNRRVLFLICLSIRLIFSEVAMKKDCFSIGTENVTDVTGIYQLNDVKITFKANESNEMNIAVIGGSTSNPDAPFHTGMAALRSGADKVFIITKENVVSTVKKFGQEIKVYPILHKKSEHRIHSIIEFSSIVVLGTGMDTESVDDINFIIRLIKYCKKIRKPLILGVNAIYALMKNVAVLKHFGSPGVILTGSAEDLQALSEVVKQESAGIKLWHVYWGPYVSILSDTDRFFCSVPLFNWNLQDLMSHPVQGEGDVLSGVLASLFAYAMRTNICVDTRKWQFLHSGSAYAAAIVTHSSGEAAFTKYRKKLETKHVIFQIFPMLKKMSTIA